MKTIELFKVFMSKESRKLVDNVLSSGYVGQGKKVEELENILRKHFSPKNSIGGVPWLNTVNSCTSGLQLVIHVLKYYPLDQLNTPSGMFIKDDDEILTTPLTCTATNSAILANRVRIKWVDVDPHTLNMDYDDLERKLSPKTKAIMLVHWGGYPCDLDRVKKIQEKCKAIYGFFPPVIEDCAHAWGAEYKDQLIGTHGNYAVFSFQAIKHFTTADGGVIVSPNNYERIKLLRWYGLDRTSSEDFRCQQNIKEYGFKYHMNDINAAIGLGNYPHINSLVEKHRANGEYLNRELKKVNGVTLLENKDDRKSSYWIYSILVEDRVNFIKMMKNNSIAVSQVHDRNDKHGCFKDFKAALPNLDIVANKMICIPCGWWVSEDEREYIVDCMKKGW